MSLIDNLIVRIKNGEFSKEKLGILLTNTLKSNDYPDSDKEQLIMEIKKFLRAKPPAIAKKISGTKNHEATEKLHNVYLSIDKDFNLAANKVNNGVKTGGNVQAGEAHLYQYISYKNAAKFGAHLALKQIEPDDELTVVVKKYRDNENEGLIQENEFSAAELPHAESIYRDYLAEIISR